MTTKKIEMLPPWLFRPNQHPYDIGWRMGGDEWYLMKLGEELEKLTPEEIEEYFDQYDIPEEWQPFVDSWIDSD